MKSECSTKRAAKRQAASGRRATSNREYAGARLSSQQVAEIRALEAGSHPTKKAYAKQLRRKMTPAETAFWKAWQSQRLSGLAPQVPVFGYIPDFLHVGRKVIIEIDGSAHDGRKAYDAERDANLARCGYAVHRFQNREVLANPDAVVEKVKAILGIQGMRKRKPRKGLLASIWAQAQGLLRLR